MGLAETAQHRFFYFWTVTRSQVYRELATMARSGLVEEGEKGKREARPFTITAAGRAAFTVRLSQRPGPGTVRLPFLLTLAFGSYLERAEISEPAVGQARA